MAQNKAAVPWVSYITLEKPHILLERHPEHPGLIKCRELEAKHRCCLVLLSALSPGRVPAGKALFRESTGAAGVNKYLSPIHLPASLAPTVSPEPLRGFRYRIGIGTTWEQGCAAGREAPPEPELDRSKAPLNCC